MGIWIVEPNGPCLYKLVTGQKFRGIDENLVSGFFVALQAFAKTIGSEEVEKIILKDMSFSFISKSNAVIVAATEKDDNVIQLLGRISSAFEEILSAADVSPFNPLIPSDIDRIGQKISGKIGEIIAANAVPQREKAESARYEEPQPVLSEKPEATRAGSLPKMVKSLTGVLRRSSREREMLVKRFGIIAVDVLHYVNGERTIDQIVTETGVARAKIEEILDFASKLGVVKFL
jgi:hypothetical protein